MILEIEGLKNNIKDWISMEIKYDILGIYFKLLNVSFGRLFVFLFIIVCLEIWELFSIY